MDKPADVTTTADRAWLDPSALGAVGMLLATTVLHLDNWELWNGHVDRVMDYATVLFAGLAAISSLTALGQARRIDDSRRPRRLALVGALFLACCARLWWGTGCYPYECL